MRTAPASAEVIALSPQQDVSARVRDLLKLRWRWVEAVNSDARLTDSEERIGIAGHTVSEPRFRQSSLREALAIGWMPGGGSW